MSDIEIVKLIKYPKGMLSVAIFKKEGEPFYNDIYDHSKPFCEKLNDIIKLTTLHMEDSHRLQSCIENIYNLPQRFNRKREKLLKEAFELRRKCWEHNANIRRIARGIHWE